MREDLARLERLAVTDLDARSAWVRALTRLGDPRARLIALTIEPGSAQWIELCTLHDELSLEDQDAAIVWLNPLLSHWKKLSLKGTQVRDVSALAKLTNLTRLDLDWTKVNDISALAALTHLEYLDLSATQVSNVSALANLTNLRILYLNETQVSDVSALAPASLHLTQSQPERARR
jgi:Leucine-rich repeat (LRR) protein